MGLHLLATLAHLHIHGEYGVEHSCNVLTLHEEQAACLKGYKHLEKFCNKSHSTGFGIPGRTPPETNHSRQIFNTYCSGQAQNSIIVKFKFIICQAQYS